MILNGKCGVCYVAYGAPAVREFGDSYKSLCKMRPDLPVAVVGDEKPPLYRVEHVPFRDDSFGARWAKLNLDSLSPFEHTLYLDADTRVMSTAVAAGFQILQDGYDIVLVPSARQGEDIFGHIKAEEREYTIGQLGNADPLQLQAGVLFFAKNERTAALFEAWRDEWQRYRRHDQAALLRALDKAPVRIWLLSYAWNSLRGEVVEHWFGRAVA